MLISEQLYLLLTKATGTQERPGTQRGYGLTAALIADLVTAGRVTLTEEKRPRMDLVDTTPTGSPVLDSGLTTLESKSGKRLDRIVSSARLDPEDAVVSSLVNSGILERGERTMMGLGKPRTPEVNSGPEQELRARLTAVLAGTSEPTTADSTLLSILQALGVARKILEEESGGMRGGQLKKRIQAIVDQSPTGDAVERAMQALSSAIVTAAVIPAVVAGGASG
jgi:hypothetical protein